MAIEIQGKERMQEIRELKTRLYDLAFRYEETELWQRIWEGQVFGVRFSDGEVGYICVMGMGGELVALAIFLGSEGLRNYRAIHGIDHKGLKEIEKIEIMNNQNCLMMSLMQFSELRERDRNEVMDYARSRHISLHPGSIVPEFMIWQRHRVEWHVTKEQDLVRFIEGLEAAISMSRRIEKTGKEPYEDHSVQGPIGVLTKTEKGRKWEKFFPPEDTPPVYSEAAFRLDQVRSIRMRRKTNQAWAVDLFLSPGTVPAEEEDDVPFAQMKEAPVYPMVLAVVNIGDEGVITMGLTRKDDYVPELLEKLVEAIMQCGRPDRFVVSNERARVFLQKAAEQIDVGFEVRETLPEMDALEEDFIDRVLGR